MTTLSEHASVRAHQRGVPPIIFEWLEQFGEETFDGRGGIVRFFSHASRKRLERRFGRRFVSENRKYLDRYLVESVSDGTVITAGVRFRPVARR